MKEIKERVSGVYKIVNKVNGKYYVGSSKDIFGCDGREYQHFNMLKKNYHPNDHLQLSYNKYGKENFILIAVEINIPENQLLVIEQNYLDIAKTEKHICYNGSFIAGKIEFTDDVRKKMSDAKIGKCDGTKNPAYVHVPEDSKSLLREYWIVHGKTKLIKYAEVLGFGEGVARRLIKEFRQNKNDEELRKKYKKIAARELFDKNPKLIMNKEKNVNYNPNIYHFYNKKLNIHFVGTGYEMNEKFGLKNSLRLIKVKKARNGWAIIFE